MATERAEVLRPAPEQGNTIAAAAVALTALVGLVNGRFEDEWGVGVHLVYTAAAALVVIGMAAMSPKPVDRPATWQSVLFVASFVLFFGTLTNLADVLGADDAPFGAPGTAVWVGLLLAGLAGWFAAGWNSGISTLLLALTLIVVVVELIDWVFGIDSTDTLRWVLLFVALGVGAIGLARRDSEPHHAVGFINAAGVAVLVLAGTFLADIFEAAIASAFGAGGDAAAEVGWGWELFILFGAAGLIAYSVTTRQAGPGYLGAANLAAFVGLSASPGEDGASLIGWPLVLIVVTIGLFALARGGGRPGPGVPARPSPDPSESPTAVQPRP